MTKEEYRQILLEANDMLEGAFAARNLREVTTIIEAVNVKLEQALKQLPLADEES